MQAIQMRDVKPGEYFKRKPDAKAVYVKGHYDKSSRTFSATDFDDTCREIFVKASKPVYVGFDF